MRDEQSRIARLGWVGLVRCFQPLTMFVPKTVSDVAEPLCRHDTTPIACDVTHTGSGRDHPTQPTHPNQTDRQRAAGLGMARNNIRTVVSRRVVPFGPICMRGSTAHDPASVWRWN